MGGHRTLSRNWTSCHPLFSCGHSHCWDRTPSGWGSRVSSCRTGAAGTSRDGPWTLARMLMRVKVTVLPTASPSHARLNPFSTCVCKAGNSVCAGGLESVQPSRQDPAVCPALTALFLRRCRCRASCGFPNSPCVSSEPMSRCCRAGAIVIVLGPGARV